VISGHFLDGIGYKSPSFVLLLFSAEFSGSLPQRCTPCQNHVLNPFGQTQSQGNTVLFAQHSKWPERKWLRQRRCSLTCILRWRLSVTDKCVFLWWGLYLPTPRLSLFCPGPCRSLRTKVAYNLVVLSRRKLPARRCSAQIETLRTQLFKLGARVRQTTRCRWFHLDRGWPFSDLFQAAALAFNSS